MSDAGRGFAEGFSKTFDSGFIMKGLQKRREEEEKKKRYTRIRSAIEQLDSGEYETVLDSFDDMDDLKTTVDVWKATKEIQQQKELKNRYEQQSGSIGKALTSDQMSSGEGMMDSEEDISPFIKSSRPSLTTSSIGEAISAPDTDYGLPPQKITQVYQDDKGVYKEREVDNPAYKIEYEKLTGKVKEHIKLEGKINQKEWETNQAMRAVFGQLQSLISYKAAQFEEAGGDSLSHTFKSWAMAKMLRPGYGRTAAFYGARAQTAMRSTPLITGSVRIVRDITKMMFDSLPNLLDPSEYTAQKAVQTLDDFYVFSKAVEKAATELKFEKNEEGQYVIPEDLDYDEEQAFKDFIMKETSDYELSPKEVATLEELKRKLMETPPAPTYEMKYRGQSKPAETEKIDEDYERFKAILGK
jgi:hypothetical protein